ncbi:hypothetical protein DFH28DRAFT_1084858 [Melampsora americana]|nr:hypothetical protein DFH28DRAFT_1084858 [Melampsora americana]
MFNTQVIEVQPERAITPVNPSSYVDIDLTVATPPSAPLPSAPVQPQAPLFEAKPSHVKLWFQVYAPIAKTRADKQCGAAQKYTDLSPKAPFDAIIQIHGAELVDVRDQVFDACDAYKTVCGSILKIAHEEGKVIFKGYVAGRGDFLKSALKPITSEDILDRFKATMLDNKGKEVGFRLIMDNPKTVNRLKSKEDTFDQAVRDNHPDTLPSARNDELDMLAIRVKLMKDYGCISIGGRECMGIINPENPNKAVHLSHSMMDTWATDIFKHKPGVTTMMPPTRRAGFQWVPISNRPHQPPKYTADSVASTSQIPLHYSESPPPYPLPEFEDFLRFAKIETDDHTTRDLLQRHNIVEFESFLSPAMDIPTLERLGFAYGTAVRLHDKAVLYRSELKRRKNPTFWN